MAVTPERIAIVGCGPGSAQYLTEAARHAVAQADVLVGTRRLLDLFPQSVAETIFVSADIPLRLERIERLRSTGKRIAVLVTGDPGLYSLAQTLTGHFGREHCEIVPGISAVQVAFARLGLDWANARIVTAHGRVPDVTADDLRRHDRIAILAGTVEAGDWTARLAADLDADYAAFLAENLTLENEQFRRMTAKQLDATEIASLSIVLLIRRSLLS